MMEIRKATPKDIAAFYEEPLEVEILTATIVTKEGVALWLGGGYYSDGLLFAASSMKPGMRRYKKTMVKAAKSVMAELKALGAPVYAVPNREEATAERFLRALGFSPTGHFSEYGEMFSVSGGN